MLPAYLHDGTDHISRSVNSHLVRKAAGVGQEIQEQLGTIKFTTTSAKSHKRQY